MKKREMAQINKIRNEREVITDTTAMQRIIKTYCKQLHAKKLDNLGKMDKFLETYLLSKLNQEEESQNRLLTTSETEAVIKKLPAHKSPGPDGFTGKFYQIFKEDITTFLKLFQKIQEQEDYQIHFRRLLLS